MEHTLHVVDKELDALAAQVRELAGETEALLNDALAAALDGKDELVDSVVQGDQALDQLTSSIEKASIRLIALRQPRADDLRRPVAAMKIALNLERCGDLAKNIAKRGRVLWRLNPEGLETGAVRRLAEKVAGALSALRAAYDANDVEGVLSVWRGDADVDALHQAASRQLLEMMTSSPDKVESGMHLLFVAKNLERIGDHATNIAELIHYEMVGSGPEGARPKLDPLDDRL